ncbi:nagb/rpia/CoA transferase-like protein [Westerdykella ornata]|uniref:Translation initiation factor eIF2B subunit alpha n=1 Tax=Westerdykella ornata TaxID=318751 RepID=A0A6A6J909_WESOR|nr:nagb/rpia/CoA transferase-like protein [Westerdykella ornata]KAF2273050.1 nagb/rpia/CoA transferase-like protein [Westerdykella ornata]
MSEDANNPPAEDPEFDVVARYHEILASDPDLTMPVAAIEALIEAITANTQVTTVAETMELLEEYTGKLKASVPNHISLSAGTDLFQRYLVHTLTRTSIMNGSFTAIRNHLLSSGRLFVANAKASREKIAEYYKHLLKDGVTILTNGGSRVVSALLRKAAESTLRFQVIYVLSPAESADSREGHSTVADLRAHGVPVATIPDSAVAYCLEKVNMVIVGAEGVVENGGIISRLGTYQMGLLAKSKEKPFYVVTESHKFVRLFPLGQFDLPIKQNVLEFKAGDDAQETTEAGRTTEDRGATDINPNPTSWKCSGLNPHDAVDYTPPRLISGIITESGVMTPSAVSEELIKIWF